MPKFQSYQKIAENTAGWELSPKEWRHLERLTWVVTEKIHGANFGWLTDGHDVVCAKRKALLEQGDGFFGYQRVHARLRDSIASLFQRVLEMYPGCTSIQLYGELFGGGYPHPDVSPVAGVQPIQTGVYYTPDVEFCAFDLALWFGDVRELLDYDEAMGFCEEEGLLYAKPLFRGSFSDAMAFSCRFDSTIPAIFGLPALPEANLAEGVVLKPVEPISIATRKGQLRPILKRKIATFAEDERYHLAQKWGDVRSAGAQDPLVEAEWRMLAMVTPARLASASSKLGALTTQLREPTCDEMQRDVWSDMELNHPDLVVMLSAEDVALLKAVLEEVVEALVGASLS